jgi:hypothetical protein
MEAVMRLAGARGALFRCKLVGGEATGVFLPAARGVSFFCPAAVGVSFFCLRRGAFLFLLVLLVY